MLQDPLTYCQIRSQTQNPRTGCLSQSYAYDLKTDRKPFCCRSFHSGAALWTRVCSRPRHPPWPPLPNGELPASALRLPPVCLLPGWVIHCVEQRTKHDHLSNSMLGVIMNKGDGYTHRSYTQTHAHSTCTYKNLWWPQRAVANQSTDGRTLFGGSLCLASINCITWQVFVHLSGQTLYGCIQSDVRALRCVSVCVCVNK